MRSEGQRLTAHLKATIAECERLKLIYCHAIDQLETYTLPNLSPQSAAQWFEMYLRVIDLGVQIRRGEIRHRTTQRFTYPCMHKTGIKRAMHSGLSIDDGNAIYKLMDDRKLVKESRLDSWFIKIDGLDRDDIGPLDKRLTGCLENFRRRNSVFYERLEVTGEDPHEKLLVLGEPGASASRVVVKATRTCFGPTNCHCKEDAQPWEGFSLTSGALHAQNLASAGLGTSAEGVQVNEVGIVDIKRQMGFEQLSREEKYQDAAALARDAAELTRDRRTYGQSGAVSVELRAPPSARSIYQKRCVEIGSKPKPLIEAALAVKKGAYIINLSGIGFHSADDLLDLVDIFALCGLPPVKEVNLSNGFFNATAFQVLCHLLRLPVLRQTVERLSFRSIAVPQPADIAVLMRLLTSDGSSIGSLPALDSLKTLDLSFNTLWGEGAACLQPLLASLKGLKKLSLESCFPEPVLSSDSTFCFSDGRLTEENVRVILTEVSSRLQCLNFGSNYIGIGSLWLDAIFTAESTLQKLELQGVTGFSNYNAETMEADWQAGEIWDLQQLETLTWSSSAGVYTNKLLNSLSAELQGGFAQLKHLDMKVNITTVQDGKSRAVRKVADTITRIADYGALRSCHICCYSQNEAISHNVNASVMRLLEDGLYECEVLTLRMSELCLDSSAICDLLSSVHASKMRKMTLAVGIAAESNVEPIFDLCFLQIQAIQEITLELHAAVDKQSEAKSNALARKLKASWLGLSSSFGNCSHNKKRPFNFVNGKANRSFELSEQRKANKQIYRCRFITTSMPR
ncbi:unnamed protein product [Peronospora destructor]|uniref:Uncharacterized protein n=1 Tax=Peronospora destructor TaxID=86335 RepID=A0AAV0T5U9_9STRA|nr:unnamed protein product [Peronospora destructor]